MMKSGAMIFLVSFMIGMSFGFAALGLFHHSWFLAAGWLAIAVVNCITVRNWLVISRLRRERKKQYYG